MEVDLNSESSDTINQGGIYQFWIHYGGYNESTGTAFLIMPDCPTGQIKKNCTFHPHQPLGIFLHSVEIGSKCDANYSFLQQGSTNIVSSTKVWLVFTTWQFLA